MPIRNLFLTGAFRSASAFRQKKKALKYARKLFHCLLQFWTFVLLKNYSKFTLLVRNLELIFQKLPNLRKINRKEISRWQKTTKWWCFRDQAIKVNIYPYFLYIAIISSCSRCPWRRGNWPQRPSQVQWPWFQVSLIQFCFDN